MKAFDILLALTVFNMIFWAFGELGLFGEAAPPGEEMAVAIDIAGVRISGVAVIAALALAIAAASITVLGTRVIRPIGVVAVAFAAMYGYMLASAMEIFYSFKIGTTNLVPVSIIGVLTTVNILFFVIGIMQLVSGGWRGHK